MLRCSLHPATQYTMRHSDVQMSSFGTDHNSGSWLWSVIPFLSLSFLDSGQVDQYFQKIKPTEGKAFFFLDDNCSKFQIRQSDKLTKGNRKYWLIQWLMKNHLQFFL